MTFKIKLSYSKAKQSNNNKNAYFKNTLGSIVEVRRHTCLQEAYFLVSAAPLRLYVTVSSPAPPPFMSRQLWHVQE